MATDDSPVIGFSVGEPLNMKKKNIPVEFVFQLFALIIAIIIVHAFYVSIVRPNAAEVLEAQAIEREANPDYVTVRSTWILIKDMEQEACFVLMFWALAIMGYKAKTILEERALLDVELIPIAEGMRILPEDTREFARQVQALPDTGQKMLLPRALLNALRRFSTTRNIQDVSSSSNTIFDSEADRLESELSMIRYISWAIPSIGFIGTVRGIGEALAQADKAVQGDIAGVTQSLGVAFNSTFIALLISIFLMFLVYQLQLLQERLVFDSQIYVDDKLIRHMKSD
jgi:biopolymer transport protein ExbB/TolQ